jgi:hypothetical protein
MTRPRPEMACERCHRPLNTLGDPNHPRYIHPLAAGVPDHEPIPVPASELDTLARQCDFCGDPQPLWTLVGGEVSAVAVGDDRGLWQNYGDRWAACATCEHLITTGKADAVVDRAAATYGWRNNPDGRRRIAELHLAFLRGLQPGRTLITTTAWPAAPLQVQDLPRVRDRLARLYRGPDNLPEPFTEAELRHSVADSLDKAKLYWIDPDFTDLAEHAAGQLPETATEADDAPAADGLLIWSRPVTARQLAAASWTAHSDGYRIVCYRHLGVGLDNITLQRVREQIGWLAPTPFTQVGATAPLPHGWPASALVATWLLIAQQIAVAVPADIDRATRKSYARQQRPTPDVRIVRIKARRAGRVAKTGAATGTGRGPLQQREWVGAHWKQQAFGPGRGQRKLIYVAPYLRGPDDKPIRASTTVRVLGSSRASWSTDQRATPDNQ